MKFHLNVSRRGKHIKTKQKKKPKQKIFFPGEGTKPQNRLPRKIMAFPSEGVLKTPLDMPWANCSHCHHFKQGDWTRLSPEVPANFTNSATTSHKIRQGGSKGEKYATSLKLLIWVSFFSQQHPRPQFSNEDKLEEVISDNLEQKNQWELGSVQHHPHFEF